MKTESITRTLEGLFNNMSMSDEDEFVRVDTLFVSRLDYDGSVLDVDFEDLKKFPNLFNLTIDHCIIDNDLIILLSSLPNLRRLTFTNCEVIEDIKDSFDKMVLYDLNLSNVNFDLSLLNKEYKKLRFEAVPFTYFSGHCEKLNIFGCNIEDVTQLLSINFDELYISSELYLKNQLKLDDSKRKITVFEENGQFIFKKVGY